MYGDVQVNTILVLERCSSDTLESLSIRDAVSPEMLCEVSPEVLFKACLCTYTAFIVYRTYSGVRCLYYSRWFWLHRMTPGRPLAGHLLRVGLSMYSVLVECQDNKLKTYLV